MQQCSQYRCWFGGNCSVRHEALLSLLDRPAILSSMVPAPQTNLWAADCAAEQTESRAEPVRLFAFQEPVDGGYRFVATCYSSMWQRYSTLDAPLRHFFEVGHRTQFITHRLLCHSSLPQSAYFHYSSAHCNLCVQYWSE